MFDIKLLYLPLKIDVRCKPLLTGAYKIVTVSHIVKKTEGIHDDSMSIIKSVSSFQLFGYIKIIQITKNI